MAYTPNLEYKFSCTLRRIAWALDVPMTKAMEEVFEFLCPMIDGDIVCKKCRDKSKCRDCLINQNRFNNNHNKKKSPGKLDKRIAK